MCISEICVNDLLFCNRFYICYEQPTLAWRWISKTFITCHHFPSTFSRSLINILLLCVMLTNKLHIRTCCDQRCVGNYIGNEALQKTCLVVTLLSQVHNSVQWILCQLAVFIIWLMDLICLEVMLWSMFTLIMTTHVSLSLFVSQF